MRNYTIGVTVDYLDGKCEEFEGMPRVTDKGKLLIKAVEQPKDGSDTRGRVEKVILIPLENIRKYTITMRRLQEEQNGTEQ